MILNEANRNIKNKKKRNNEFKNIKISCQVFHSLMNNSQISWKINKCRQLRNKICLMRLNLNTLIIYYLVFY